MDIRYCLVKNGTDTAAKAPYTIRVVPNGVANLNDLVAEILTRISSSEQRVRMALAEAAKVMLKHVLAGETVDFGGIRFKAQIPGSMDYEDSPFTPGVDEVIVCAYVDDELRGTFDGIVPVKLSAEEVAASIRVSNVMDIATEAFGEIHGTAPFKVLGNGITLDSEGESAKLLDRKTGEVLATATVSTVSKGQRATCAFAAVPGGIAKGAYVLEVTTFGLVGDAKPHVFRKPVTLVEAIPEPQPVITNIKSMSALDGEILPAETIDIEGSNLKIPDGVGVPWTSTDPNHPSGEIPHSALIRNTDDGLTLDYIWEGGSFPNFPNDTILTFTVKGVTASAKFVSTF